MKIWISGEHTGEPRHLRRVRLPPHIEQYILDAAARGENASHVLAQAVEQYPEFEERLTKTRVQNLISSFRTRQDGIPRVANLFELDSEFADYRLTPALLQSVKDNNQLPSKVVHIETNFDNTDFACALTSTDMLISLKWYLDSCQEGFPLYIDTQQKVIRGKPKVVWIGSTRTRYDARKKKYTHSFIPFAWAIVREESAAVYGYMLEKLDELVRKLVDDRTLADYVNLCVHDAHQGAMNACREKFPGIRNARCFYHFSKNLRDNKKKLGEAFPTVQSCIFPLHISTNDELYHLLARALTREAHSISSIAGNYLEKTLDTERYGFPNIAIASDGLRGCQVANNIVEAMNSIMSKALNGEKFDIGVFVRGVILIMRSVKKSSPQCFITRPTPIIMREYHPEMRNLGTDLFNKREFLEVTEYVCDRMNVSERTQFFLFANNRVGAGHPVGVTPRIEEYLDGVVLGEFGEGAGELDTGAIINRY